MAYRHDRPNGLSGTRGLLASLIDVAAKDATGGDGGHRASAVQYLAGDAYKHHLSALGLAPDMLPQQVEEIGREYSEILANE